MRLTHRTVAELVLMMRPVHCQWAPPSTVMLGNHHGDRQTAKSMRRTQQ
jgi:hypothetical protein